MRHPSLIAVRFLGNKKTTQPAVMRYKRQLMMAILYGKAQIARAVNATVISLEEAPQGTKDFRKGAARSSCSILIAFWRFGPRSRSYGRADRRKPLRSLRDRG